MAANRRSLWIWLAAVALCFSAPVYGQDAPPAWTPEANKAWWDANPTPASWAKAADALQANLEAVYKQSGPSCFSQPDFQGWMEHLEWVRLGLACPDLLGKPDNLQTFIALGEDETLSHLLVEKMVPKNVKAQTLQNLINLAQAGMADLHEYAALGVAFSLVFDEPFPNDWPHAQVSQSAVPIGDLDIVKRFQFYVQANRDKKLELDPTQLRVEDLKYLVDSEVSLSELAYAQDESGKIPYDHFADAFFSITYNESRVSSENQAFKWNFPTYKLSDIETHGGICVDQAYYAFLLGKGRGIPTIFFTGQGISGGHAWFGYLSRSGKWELDCGRYASQNYPKGYALDPQTWQQINDSTLQRLAKDGDSDPRYRPAKAALAWAQMHYDGPLYPQILEDARTLMPELAEPWQAEGDFIDKSTTATIDDKKTFYQSWINQFQNDPDMKVEAQKRLLVSLKAANDPDADGLQRDIVLENRSTGFDLGVQGSLGGIEDKFKAQDWDGAKIAFETSVRDFKDQGGGTFFNNIVEPYVMMCLQYGRPDQADDGLHFTEERMPMDSQSLVAMEFGQLKDKVKWGKDAFPAMDKWLGELDGGDYAQAWNDGSKTLQDLVPSDQFVGKMSEMRTPFGKCSSRTMSEYPRMGEGITLNDGKALHGEFVEASYTGTFDNNWTGKERVTFTKDDDGNWRALFYTIEK
jgi:hypothetical protein